MRWLQPALLAMALLLLASTSAQGELRILVTNDDGFDSPGIAALRQALIDAGHDVTVVAPATQQSGKGGSLNTGVFDFTVGEGTMMLTNHGDDVWSLAGTPSDSVKAGLDIVMADAPPDLVVSGLNEGQNIGQPGSNGSGTIGAALRAAFSGVPAIAASVEILFSEAGDDFPSTQAAYAPAGEFIARAIAALERKNGADVLPNAVRLLNVNFPVPYEEIVGVQITALGEGSDLELPLFDPSQGFPDFGIEPLDFPSCAEADTAGEFCFATPGLSFSPSPDAVNKSDLDALRARMITITPMSADMTGQKIDVEGTLGNLDP